MILKKEDLKQLVLYYNVSYHDALLLLSSILKIEYSKLFFEKAYDISESDYAILKSFLARRGKSEPIAKIIQEKEFYGLCFKTTHDTLDPRPETELLIDIFKRYHRDTAANLKILDLGSGTGCICITLLKLYQNAICCFVDISTGALEVAKENARFHQVDGRSDFIRSNWFEHIDNTTFDVIISNPPYVASNYKIDKETSYDPPLSLFAGVDGMDAYKVILPQAHEYLNGNGLLLVEIGIGQSSKIAQISTNLRLLHIEKDLAGIERTCIFRKEN